MSHLAPSPLVIAVRVFPDLKDDNRDFDKPKREWHRPDAMLVFDTETRTDQTQRLTFGSYRFIVGGQLACENLFYGDDLPVGDRRILERHVAAPSAVIPDEDNHDVTLLTRHQFVDNLFKNAYKGRCLLIAFNFPFDISRAACNFANARGRFAGGFSLDLWSYADGRNRFRPSICIKHIDSKRALKGFTRRKDPDEEDLIPEGSTTGKKEEDYAFRGHFLDLRTLAFALTDKGYTLEKACEDFGVEHGKQRPARHGVVTDKYIKYNRRDVLATSELATKLLEEYDKHDIELQETKAYSPASIGKAYLRRMGIKPILQRQPDFPKTQLGHAQSAFFGGRTSAHIRRVPVPVV
jgi:rRNA maturation protein Nop10